MQGTDANLPQFHFALPRLVTRLTGGNSEPTETNWVEANIVGAAVMLISYLGLRQWLFGNIISIARDLLLLIPLVLATWIFWLVAIYVNALIIRLLRSVGVWSDVPDARAQSVLVVTIASLFACELTRTRSWVSIFAAAWICAVCANVVAAMLLAVIVRRRNAK